eukprot:6412510-Prymnesium_polylepis.1
MHQNARAATAAAERTEDEAARDNAQPSPEANPSSRQPNEAAATDTPCYLLLLHPLAQGLRDALKGGPTLRSLMHDGA